MKKAVKLSLCLLCFLLLLCACTEGADETRSQPFDRSLAMQESSFPPPENSNSSIEQSLEETTDEESGNSSNPMMPETLFDGAEVREIAVDGGSFRVSQIKKDYCKEEVVLLHIINQSKKDYCLTIDGNYLDENGKVLKTERQTFIQYYAGYENYFFFRPKTKFAEFSYSLSFEDAIDITVEDFFGNIQQVRADDVSYRFSHTEEHLLHIEPLVIQENDQNKYPTLVVFTNAANKQNATRFTWLHWVIYNEHGEIVSIYGDNDSSPGNTSLGDTRSAFPIFQTVKNTLVLPEQLTGTLCGIPCIHWVSATVFPEEDYPKIDEMPPFEPSNETTNWIGTLFDFEQE